MVLLCWTQIFIQIGSYIGSVAGRHCLHVIAEQMEHDTFLRIATFIKDAP